MAGLLVDLRRQLYKKHRSEHRAQSLQSSPVKKSESLGENRTSQLPPVNPHSNERNTEIVSKDDILLKQIDEFRERAAQLQSMLDTREQEAQELQTIVDERQEKADALGEILKERQEVAEGIQAAVEKQIDSLIAQVGVKMDEIEASVREELSKNSELSTEKAEEIKESLIQIQEQLGVVKGEVSDKIHTENVKCYRNISDLFKSMDEKVEHIVTVESRVDGTHKLAVAALVVSIVNLIGILCLVLLNLGVIGF